MAAFKAEEAVLPPERREWPAVQALEERFGDLDSHRLAALRRLLRVPAPVLAALSLKLDFAVADQAWELEGCDTCLVNIAHDAQRLSGNIVSSNCRYRNFAPCERRVLRNVPLPSTPEQEK